MTFKSDRIAIVTGASAGIGRATVHKLLGVGVRVVGCARRPDRLHAMEKEAQERHGRPCFVSVAGDVQDPATIERLLSTSIEAFGGAPDIFLVNAGKGLPGSILHSDQTKWEELFQLNCLSVLHQMKAAASVMLETAKLRASEPKAQDIVVLGSIVGRHLSPVNPVYGATKYAVHSLAEALRRDLAPHWIRVTLVEPGTVATEFQDAAGYDAAAFADYERQIGPFVTGDDVANFIVFALSQPAHVHFNNVVIRPTRQTYP
ncbi:SDR family oxidoreductase [Burkholderia multivorans]|uniref:NAD(P)-dependent oxidoreductase n=1 Tax=Burkholderia multivorans TaxID=87883 RepID=A0AB37AN16_9BURK|nr:SDR family oxidoreductase [Burkholderia multivorans]MBU9589635.1 SDR family oxidoreductase [Burkholderia multivorans]PRE39291.1 NAD(P)-dependent oxidoreductase [Burkholderia multivorans]PRE42288.1 NAD(P)-dependent oxidoreductase [Burkholderia multivorans]